jgi:uncharacterized CHY-type Zn-finger protein
MSGGYDQHQKHATRLICGRCKQPYDVTHAEALEHFVCAWCKRERVNDVNGNPMEGGATGP